MKLTTAQIQRREAIRARLLAIAPDVVWVDLERRWGWPGSPISLFLATGRNMSDARLDRVESWLDALYPETNSQP